MLRFRILADKKLSKNKSVLKRVLTEKNLEFLHDYDLFVVEELVQLVVLFGISLNFYTDDIDVSKTNLIHFLHEMKKRGIVNSEFIKSIWKIVGT